MVNSERYPLDLNVKTLYTRTHTHTDTHTDIHIDTQTHTQTHTHTHNTTENHYALCTAGEIIALLISNIAMYQRVNCKTLIFDIYSNLE